MNKDLPKTYNSWIGKKRCEEYLKEENVENTPWRDQSSENSLSFKNCDVIKDVFGVKKIQEKLDSRITTLHSSALLAYLVFQGVNEEHPVKINGIEYNRVYFEQSNRVFGGSSKTDITLVSKDENIVLYLESKFTEPYENKHDSKIFSVKYDQMLKHICSEGINGIKYKEANGGLKITGCTYGEGIKQMLAHFIGVCKGGTKNNEVNKIIKKEKTKVYLGCILYKTERPEFDEYCKALKIFTERLNEILPTQRGGEGSKCDVTDPEEILTHAPKNFRVLTEVLTYQDLIKANPNLVNDKIKDFYSFK